MSSTEQTERIDKIIEDWLQTNWTLENPAASEIAFGYKGTQLLNSKKHITLRCIALPTTITHPAIERFEHIARVRIDVFAKDRSSTNKSRSPKLTNIHKYLETFFSSRTNILGLQPQGIHWVKLTFVDYLDDNEYNDVMHLMMDLECTIWKAIT